MREMEMTNFWKTTPTSAFLIALIVGPMALAQPNSIDIKGAPIPIQVLAQSPAETTTDLQVVCLFRSSPVNTLHGSLTETNEKLSGLLERIRKPELFRGELGETLLLTPPKDRLGAKMLLIIGLGDSQSFSPQRMQLVGEIVYHTSVLRPDHSRWRCHQIHNWGSRRTGDRRISARCHNGQSFTGRERVGQPGRYCPDLSRRIKERGQHARGD
jgi:hypothetical protein